MNFGIPKEVKNNENRVGITPAGVIELVHAGQKVYVEHNAGLVAGYTDRDYQDAEAAIVDADTAWSQDVVIKVKEPLPDEYHYFHPGLILYTYLHLAANQELTEALLKSEVTAIGYETMVGPNHTLPALTPMSQVAGRMAVIIGSQYLQTQYGGKGILISSVPGVAKAQVVVIGAGTVGMNAARAALDLGAHVTLLDINPAVLERMDNLFEGRVQTLFSDQQNLTMAVRNADLVIGAVLIPGAKAPKLVSEDMIKSMAPGSVVVDIPIDQGGIFATTDHATTFADPVYTKHGVIHYAVANIPGAVPRTATDALTSVTVPYAAKIGRQGVVPAIEADSTIATGVNTYQGHLVEKAVADSLGLPYTDLNTLLA
ncbi:alanine dehydrogenase [Schleiferilactobacillus shenzhenensis]|uniref:Alanine dehydrogenase n=1 Tax=Schleiferilactobacillus shenzhenensis LY-73 TaxID=1231336 RepID=U4TTN1_9LACO|nr:alanine dehydrogenase [Schleiferilactobacillus shenzhenensis]ERL65248.1 Ald [Schleiferilactobacillus shenzhenensis LY-73]